MVRRKPRDLPWADDAYLALAVVHHLSEIENGIPADRAEHRIMIDAAAPRGVSGGGVFEVETGRLVGIVQGHQTVSVTVKDQTQT